MSATSTMSRSDKARMVIWYLVDSERMLLSVNSDSACANQRRTLLGQKSGNRHGVETVETEGVSPWSEVDGGCGAALGSMSNSVALGSRPGHQLWKQST